MNGMKQKFHFKKKKSNVLRDLDLLLKCFPLLPHPLPGQHTPPGHSTPELLVEPEEHCSLEAGPETQHSWPQPPPLQCRESTIRKTTSRKLWGRSSQECQSSLGLAPGKPHPLSHRAPVLGYAWEVRVSWLLLPTSPVKPQKLTFREGQKCEQPGTGTSLPVSIMAYKHSPGHTRVFVEQKYSESLFKKEIFYNRLLSNNGCPLLSPYGVWARLSTVGHWL